MFIRQLLGKMFNAEIASSVRIQYGGSVTPDNIVSADGPGRYRWGIGGRGKFKSAFFRGHRQRC